MLATAVFLVGMLVYFVLIPGALTPESYQSWVPSLVLYGALDWYMLLTLVYLHRTAAEDRWRIVYGWLAVGVGGFAFTDALEVLYNLGLMEWLTVDSPLNIIWNLPYLALGMAGRAPRHRH